jgi:hypothetical protein
MQFKLFAVVAAVLSAVQVQADLSAAQVVVSLQQLTTDSVSANTIAVSLTKTNIVNLAPVSI